MTTSELARVLLVDGSQLITEGLRLSLRRTSRYQTVGIAHTAVDALRCLRGMSADLVITDVDVPGGGPLRTLRDVRNHCPAARTVVLAGMDSPAWAKVAVDLGAAGYLLKTSPVDELLAAIAEVADGATGVLDPRLGRYEQLPAELPPPTQLHQLSVREFDVLAELLKGLDNQTIAGRLFISHDTVKTHVKAILRKLGARDRAHAVSIVLTNRRPFR